MNSDSRSVGVAEVGDGERGVHQKDGGDRSQVTMTMTMVMVVMMVMVVTMVMVVMNDGDGGDGDGDTYDSYGKQGVHQKDGGDRSQASDTQIYL